MKYDHVILGGGSAGAVLAGRLSENADAAVLLVEAGPDFPDVDSIPEDLRNVYSTSFTAHDWGYRASVTPGRSIAYARGRVTGGCSAINGAIALRGLPSDYDQWGSYGNDAWSWDACLPYFLRLEDDRDFEDEMHGQGGPVPIVRWREDELVPIQESFTQACLAAGLGYTEDHNQPASQGIGPIPMNREGALRISTAIAYLGPARGRDNLTVMANTLASRIVFKGTRAVGVEVVTNGQRTTIETERVILSAGTFDSPQILMRSGVGPERDLRAAGIPTINHLPGVGANLIDHPLLLVGMVPKQGVARAGVPDVQMLATFTAQGSDQFNDMQLYMVSKLPGDPADPSSALIVGMFVVLNRPDSRGRLTITTPDLGVQPAIAINAFDTGSDLERLTDSVRFACRIAGAPPLQELVESVAFPSHDVLTDTSALRQFVYGSSTTLCHAVGTCRMGPASDAMSVVDQHFRVHGLDGVWVVDASVMPNIPSKNPNLTCMMLAERAAEWLGDESPKRRGRAGQERRR